MLFSGANPFERLPFTPADGRGLNPQLQNPGHDDPPADAVPRLHQHHHSVRVRHGCAALPASSIPGGSTRCASGRWSPGSSCRIGITLGMWWAYVELGLGRLLGVGSGGERQPAAVAHDDGVPAFGDDPGKARDAQALEPVAGGRHVPAQHLRDVHHALGRDRERAQLHPVERRLLSSSAFSS